MANYKAVLFDMDGTLINSLLDITNGVNHVLKQHHLPLHHAGQIRHFVGNGARHLIKLSVPEGEAHPQFEQIVGEFKAYYKSHGNCNTKPYDGVIPMLDTLNARGYALGIVSNKIDASVKQLNTHYFGSRIAVAIGEKSGVRRKPAPDALLTAIEELGQLPADCVYVGDSVVDVQTAQNASVAFICVDWGYEDRDKLAAAGAACIVSSVEELLAHIQKGCA